MDWARKDFPVGAGPSSIAFDGANIWVATPNSGTVTRLSASNGALLNTLNLVGASGIVFDGDNIWISIFSGTVIKLRASDGASQCSASVPNTPQAMAFDGANIWVVHLVSSSVTKLRRSDARTWATLW